MKTTFEPMVHEWIEQQLDEGFRVQLHASDAGWTVHTFFGDVPGTTQLRIGSGATFRDAVLDYEQAEATEIPGVR